MNFDKATLLIEQGMHVQSKISQTIYSIDKEGTLHAEGVKVNPDYLTLEEKQGEWEEVHVIHTEEQFKKLTNQQIENILHSAYDKHQYDVRVGRAK